MSKANRANRRDKKKKKRQHDHLASRKPNRPSRTILIDFYSPEVRLTVDTGLKDPSGKAMMVETSLEDRKPYLIQTSRVPISTFMGKYLDVAGHRDRIPVIIPRLLEWTPELKEELEKRQAAAEKRAEARALSTSSHAASSGPIDG